MFTWICPRCGREVPPSYNECPDCSANSEKQAPVTAAPVTGSTGAVKQVRRAKAKKGLPGWALSLIFALLFAGIGAGGFYAYQYFTQKKGGGPGLEAPAAAEAAPVKANPLAKLIEITGLRLTEDANQKATVRFVVVNHSGADIADLAGTVALRPTVAKQGDPPMGTFSFHIPSLGPYESKDLSAPVETKLRAYELPDWQFLQANLRLTSPQ